VRGFGTALALAFALLSLGSCEREQKMVQQDLPAARQTKARADAQQIARAVQAYQASFGDLPGSLEALTRAQTVGGVSGGPFLGSVPTPPAGWSPYQFTKQGGNRFTISASGDGLTVTAP
jgi:Type II secretion system (T2SS), protein G